MRTGFGRAAVLLATGAALWSPAAGAQGTSTPAAAIDAGQGALAQPVSETDIVVTARKRAETVQQVPASVRALSAEELGLLGADSLQGFAGQAPGLTLTGTPNATQIVIRGVTTGPVNHDQSEIKETVGLYLDETPIAVQRYSPDLQLYDLARIEVLRGPQGTLYGAGSMAGAIRLITNKPDASRVAVSGRGRLSTVKDGGVGASADAMFNVPLVADTLAVRVVGSYRHTPGFIDNVAIDDKDVNEQNVASVRGAVRYTPSPATTLDATLSYQQNRLRANGLYTEAAGFLNTTLAARDFYRDRNISTSATLNQDLDVADLTVNGSYRRKRLSYKLENGSFTNFITGFRDGLGGEFYNYSRQRDYSTEVRIASKPESAVQWTVGGFFQRSTNSYGQDFPVAGVDAVAGIDSTDYLTERDNLYKSRIALKERQVALFGEAVVPIVGGLKASAGGRYFWARQNADLFFAGVFSSPNIGATTYKHKEDGFNPRFNLAYEFNRDHLVYLQAAKGFRLGGTNEPVPLPACQADLTSRGLDEAPTGFASDSLWNYEVGTKNSFLNRRLTVNASVYRIDWSDPQVTAQLGCGFNVFVNAGGLHVTGGELETIVEATPDLRVRLGASYINSKLTSDLAFVSGNKGDKAPYIPQWTLNGSLDYRPRLTDALTGVGFLSYVYTDKRNTRFNTALAANYTLPAYGMLTARLGVEAESWSATLYAENLANSHGRLDQRNNPYTLTPGVFITPVTPRTIGLEVDFHY